MYEDERLKQVNAEKQDAITENENMYNTMIDNASGYYDKQIEAAKDWADKQTELQNQQTNLTINEINQQKEQAKKELGKEQSAAYVDYEKQTSKHGVNAEVMGMQGLSNSGYSESSKVSMYNTYQNRVATAKASYDAAVQNYNNSIAQAKLQNSSALAEIAYTSLQNQLELSLQGFQYQNQLVLDKANRKAEIQNMYHSRYQDVLNQINTEKALAEEQRQFNAQMAEEQRQYNLSLEEERRQYNTTNGIGEEYTVEKDEATVKNTAKNSSNTSGVISGFTPIVAGDNFTNSNLGPYSTNLGNAANAGNQNLQTAKEQENKVTIEGNRVKTPYYKGELNKDVKNGTFKNGYQPDNVNGKKLYKTGYTTEVTAKTLSGEEKVITQNIWETKDGIRWVWNGMEQKYQLI